MEAVPLTPEDTTKIDKIIEDATSVLQKGWRCGETVMSLTDDHVARLQKQVQADVDAIQEKYVQETP